MSVEKALWLVIGRTAESRDAAPRISPSPGASLSCGTVESGHMTKDLALLVGPDQNWLTTPGFLDKVAGSLEGALRT